ncbi:hypothetical protein MYX77_02160 [Acidobacteriia bacterium AH_259_A11_L15]|nr:hypothetical protein [Acidobacteriia bacterium AH_259_A11_L15]
MSGVIFFIAIALLLLALVLLWAFRSAEAAPARRDLSTAQDALTAFHLELPPRALVEKIFSSEDWDFVSSRAPLEVQRPFLEERTRIARTWLRQTRNKVGELMRLYRKAVRQSRSLQLAMEVRLAVHYLSFLVIYAALSGLIWLRGPFAAKRMVQYGANLAEHLYCSAAHVLLEIDPTALSKFKAERTHS